MSSMYATHTPGVGVAFLTSRLDFSLSAFIGSLISIYWARRDADSHRQLMYVVASGLIAGEGLWGLSAALLNICTQCFTFPFV
jgi:uncharacterized oligopeptide transporter (OPT) family protein